MQKKLTLIIGSSIVIILVLILMLTEVRYVLSNPKESTATPACGSETYSGTPTPTPNALTPVDPALLPFMPTAIQPEIVDLAPDVPYDDKPSVVVQHPDCTRTMYLVAPDALDAFLENLTDGDTLELVLAPPSMLGSGEPDTPEPPTSEP